MVITDTGVGMSMWRRVVLRLLRYLDGYKVVELDQYLQALPIGSASFQWSRNEQQCGTSF